MQKFSIKFVALLLLIIPLSFIACEKQELTNPIRPKVGKPTDVSKFVKKSFKVTTNSVFYKTFANSEQSKIDYARFGTPDLENMTVVNSLHNNKEVFGVSIPLKKPKNKHAREEYHGIIEGAAITVFIDTLLEEPRALVIISSLELLKQSNDSIYGIKDMLYTYDSKIIAGMEKKENAEAIFFEQDSTILKPDMNKCYKERRSECQDFWLCDWPCSSIGILNCSSHWVAQCAIITFFEWYYDI